MRPASNPAVPHAHGLELSPRALIRNICTAIEAAGRMPDRPKIRHMVETATDLGWICDPDGRLNLRGDVMVLLSKPRAMPWRTHS